MQGSTEWPKFEKSCTFSNIEEIFFNESGKSRAKRNRTFFFIFKLPDSLSRARQTCAIFVLKTCHKTVHFFTHWWAPTSGMHQENVLSKFKKIKKNPSSQCERNKSQYWLPVDQHVFPDVKDEEEISSWHLSKPETIITCKFQTSWLLNSTSIIRRIGPKGTICFAPIQLIERTFIPCGFQTRNTTE